MKDSFKHLRNSIGVISCERFCLKLPSQAILGFSPRKGIFPKTVATFYKIEQPLYPLPRDPIRTSPAICGFLIP